MRPEPKMRTGKLPFSAAKLFRFRLTTPRNFPTVSKAFRHSAAVGQERAAGCLRNRRRLLGVLRRCVSSSVLRCGPAEPASLRIPASLVDQPRLPVWALATMLLALVSAFAGTLLTLKSVHNGPCLFSQGTHPESQRPKARPTEKRRAPRWRRPKSR